MMRDNGSVFLGALLVAGTSIGGGMLALPILTCLGGFIPSLFIYLLCWIFMTLTGLLFLEVCLWLGNEANIMTMSRQILGRRATFFTVVIYLFLFYSLTLAYLVGGGQFMTDLSGGALSPEWSILLFLLIFAPFVCCGARSVGSVNAPMMMGLVVSYFVFVFFGLSYVKAENLQNCNWSLSLFAIPVTFTSFGYQGVIPSLFAYLNRDYRKTRFAIIVGSFIPFAAYVVWEYLILGIIPLEGENSLSLALQKGESAIQPLKYHLDNPWVLAMGQFFAFFALVTSFLGVTLGLMDFLADGLRSYIVGKKRIFLWLLVFFPPLFGAFFSPNIFLSSLNYAGGFGCALLLGLLPILMVWIGRYQKKKVSEYRLIGGKFLLIILFIFVAVEIGFEIFQEMGWMQISPDAETQIYMGDELSNL